MAMLLKNIVVQQKLFVPIKGKNYAMVEGWMLAGMLTGINVMVEEPKCLSTGSEIKYSVAAKLYKGDLLVGVGYAVCSSKEAMKKSFDEYAILSMAQTRAIGKAYRNKIGFIMKLAGFQATPSEEMHKVGENVPEPKDVDTNVEPVVEYHDDYVCTGKGCGNDITKTEYDYSKKIYGKALCRDCQKLAKRK